MTFKNFKTWSDETHILSLTTYFDVIDHKTISSSGFDPLDRADEWLTTLDGPYFSYGHAVTCHLLDTFREAGLHHVFNGHGGDEVISYGFGRLNELAQQKKWWTLWRQTTGPAKLARKNRIKLALPYLSHIPIMRRILRKLNSFKKMVPSDTPQGAERYLNANLLNHLDKNRYEITQPSHRRDHTERDIHYANLSDAIQPLSLEVIAISSEAVSYTNLQPT